MNVLSLFDGMSCGQIALERAGIKVDNYFASEIDKYAIQVTMANYPNTIQLGDVTKVFAKDLPKIDLLIGGSPCQGFSFAGKGLNFDDERSKLFFEFVRLREECKPTHFLLENVQMKYEHELIISKYMKVNPIEINSSLLSAQNRVRLYWTNINEKKYGLFGDTKPDIKQPKDKGIFLKDVLEEEVDERYYISDKALERILRTGWSKPQFNPDKTGTILPKNNSGQMSVDSGTTLITEKKSRTIRSSGMGSYDNDHTRNLVVTHNMLPRSSSNGRGGIGHLSKSDGKSYCLDTNPQTNAIEFVDEVDRISEIKIKKELSPYQGDKIHFEDDKMQALSAQGGNRLKGIGVMVSMKLGRSPEFERSNTSGKAYAIDTGGKDGFMQNNKIRRLTEIECERLQTVPDNYTNHVSSTQRYKMLGNGWTIDIIAHILKHF